MKEINANQLIAQMKIMQSQAATSPSTSFQLNAPAHGFGNVLANALNEVNEYSANAEQLLKRFDMGDKSVSLAEVMVSLQKSSLSFQALTQVRNRLVSAYQDIMNMPL